MTTTLALSESLFEELGAAARRTNESAFIAEVRPVEEDEPGQRSTLLLRRLLPIPDADYLERSPRHLVIQSAGFMPAMGVLARANSAIGFIHTHPEGTPEHSAIDLHVDDLLSSVAHLRTEGKPYVSIVVSGRDPIQLAARVMESNGDVRAVDRFRVAGGSILVQSADLGAASQVFDRQVRAFGMAGQQILKSLRIGVVGVGGTGSAVLEQLVRLGVGEVVLVDDDVVEPSNLARIYGSSVLDVGTPKVDVVAASARRIGLGTRVDTIVGNVSENHVARKLRHCDVLFGCTDDQAGRAVVARLAYWYLIPTFDLGVSVRSDAGRVSEIVGRVTYLAPGKPCLLCRRRITPDGIARESLSPDERMRLAQEGYVEGLEEPAPSVVTLTSLVAATATTEMLNRIFSIGSDTAAELLLRVDQRELRRTTVEAIEGHFCVDPTKWALGDDEPFLGQLWAQRLR